MIEKRVIAAIAVIAIACLVFLMVWPSDPYNQNVEIECFGRSSLADIVTSISIAKSGIEGKTDLCLREGEAFNIESIKDRSVGVSNLMVECHENSPICYGDNAPIKITDERVSTNYNGEIKFSMVVTCLKSGDSGYSCVLGIQNPK
jgi:hypothetical protein